MRFWKTETGTYVLATALAVHILNAVMSRSKRQLESANGMVRPFSRSAWPRRSADAGAPNCVSCDIDRRSARFIPNQTHSRVGATSVALRPKCVEFSEQSSRTADGNKFCRSAISSEEATPASTKGYATPKLKGDSHEGHHQLARGRGTAVRHQHRCCPSASHKSADGLRGRDASRRLGALTVRPVSRMRGRLRPRTRAAWFSLTAGSPSPRTGSCLPTCTV